MIEAEIATLFLLNEKGFTALKRVVVEGDKDKISKVIIGKDKKLTNDFSEEIEKICHEENIPYFFRKDDFEINSKYSIAIGWRWLIDVPETNLIVFHDSILPKYRGFAPLVNYLIEKELEIGVTALFANENYDEGDIIAVEKVAIEYPIKIKKAIEIISEKYSDLLYYLLSKLGGPINSYPQDETQATYSLWRDEQDYLINWNWSAEKIVRFIDAVGEPYAGARCLLDNKLIIVEDAIEVVDLKIVNRDIGKIIHVKMGKPIIVCKEGLLKIEKAYFLENKDSIFPLKKMRSRFTS